jgi:hypothetical protein
MKCGIFNIKTKLGIVIVVILMLSSCDEEAKKSKLSYLLYETYNFDSQNGIVRTDTLFLDTLNDGKIKMRINGSIGLFKFSDSAIYFCDENLDKCVKTHSLNNYDRLLIHIEEKNIFPLFRTDSRLVGHMSVAVGERVETIYKFKEDELLNSHSVKYSYFVPDIGFILLIDYFNNDYSVIRIPKTNSEIGNQYSSLEIFIESTLNDSAFFEYPKYFEPPPMPAE